MIWWIVIGIGLVFLWNHLENRIPRSRVEKKTPRSRVEKKTGRLPPK